MDGVTEWKARNAAAAEKLRLALATPPAARSPEQQQDIDAAAQEHLEQRLAWIDVDDFPIDNPEKIVLDSAREAVRIWALEDRRGLSQAMGDLQHALPFMFAAYGRRPD
ncbi:hypothetical protein [Methylobacterium sp. WSM2598]|uniref:hypothetical protein n=1 Tax=Methylobacterium sp. WSM2598 TaxID=398261 RepID=UPI00037891E6|nr:hypothetical protein [Methylobacterium sp. WSM2598]